MKRFGLALFTAAILASPHAFAGDAYLYVNNGQAITNGEPVNVKALKARHSGSYFWFSVDGTSYIVRNPDVLRSIKPIYAPVFDMGWDFPIGEQMAVFTQQMTVLKEQLRIGLEPKPGEDAGIAVRRAQLKLEQTRLGMRQNELAERTNRAAANVNDYASRLNDINRHIEHQLHELSVELIRSGIAAKTSN